MRRILVFQKVYRFLHVIISVKLQEHTYLKLEEEAPPPPYSRHQWAGGRTCGRLSLKSILLILLLLVAVTWFLTYVTQSIFPLHPTSQAPSLTGIQTIATTLQSLTENATFQPPTPSQPPTQVTTSEPLTQVTTSDPLSLTQVTTSKPLTKVPKSEPLTQVTTFQAPTQFTTEQILTIYMYEIEFINLDLPTIDEVEFTSLDRTTKITEWSSSSCTLRIPFFDICIY